MSRADTVQLLLDAPGQTPIDLPHSPWRAWVLTDRGPVLPPVAAGSIRLSPVAGRGERALVAAVAADDPVALGQALDVAGPAQDAARVLFALRHADIAPAEAASVLGRVLGSGASNDKLLRRHWSDLHLHVQLAPGVPALVSLGRMGLGLLLVEVLVQSGRPADALGVLDSLPDVPPVRLAQTATLLAHGDHQRVIDLTARCGNVDDVSALVLVARSVAARSLTDLSTALDAATAALSQGGRGLGVMCAALEERAHIYTLAGDRNAAQADLAVLAAVADGALHLQIPPPTPLRRAPVGDPVQYSLAEARHRMRRRIAVGDRPGTFGGRHHSTYRDEIAVMFSMGQTKAAEELLLGLLDVVEDEVDELGLPLDDTFFLTLADLYQDSGRAEDLKALKERYQDAERRSQMHQAAQAAAGDPSAGEGTDAPPPSAEEIAALATALDAPGPDASASAAGTPVAPVGPVGPDGASDDAAPSEPESADPEPVDAESVEPESADPESDAVERESATPATPEPEPEPARELVAVAVTGGNDPETTPRGEAGDGGTADDDEPDDEPPTPPRELTPIERMVRGPRLRGL